MGKQRSYGRSTDSKMSAGTRRLYKENNYKTGTGQWQLFAQPIEVKPNAVLYPRLANGYTKFTEFAFVLSNSSTHEGVLAIYSFADDETPVFIYQEQTTENAKIKDVRYYPWKTDKYKVIYATPNAMVSRSPQLPTNQQPSKAKSENGLKITKALLEILIKVTIFLLNSGHSSPPPLSTCLHVFSMKILRGRVQWSSNIKLSLHRGT